MSTPKSVRVNLRFGPRTPPELMNMITALPPYKRARRLRELLERGLRDAPELRPAAHKSPLAWPRPPDLNAADPEVSDQLSTDVMALLGTSVRL